MREKEAPDNAGNRAWQRRDDDERVQPRLEIDDDHEIDQQDGKRQPLEKLCVGGAHRRRLAAYVHARTMGYLRIHLLDDLLDLIVDGAEVAPLVANEDIDRGHDVVVRDEERRARLRHGAERAKQLRVLATWI